MGRRIGMRGVYEELAAPVQSVHVESFDDFPGPGGAGDGGIGPEGRDDDEVTVLAAKKIRDALLANDRKLQASRHGKQILLTSLTQPMNQSGQAAPDGRL
jgi:hypothetical protein